MLAADGSTAGWSRDCTARTTVDWLYRRAGGGNLEPLPPGPLPADVAQVEVGGEAVPFVVRRERGTINRFISSYAMLADPAGGETDTPRWNRRLVYTFDGGAAIGRNQGTPGGSALNPELPARGYAIAHSSGTRTSVHDNMGARRRDGAHDQGALRRALRGPAPHGRRRRLRRSDPAVPVRTEPPGLLDGGIPIVSYPDMATQTIHVGDCELLEHDMDVTDVANSARGSSRSSRPGSATTPRKIQPRSPTAASSRSASASSL